MHSEQTKWTCRAALLLSLLLLASACGGREERQLSAGVQTDPAALGLPVPSLLPGRVASAGLFLNAGNFSLEAPASRILPQGSKLLFQPQPQALPGLAAMAWACYFFSPGDEPGGLALKLSWYGAAPAGGQAWIAVADFSRNAWRWQQLDPQAEQSYLGLNSPELVNGSGQLALLVLLGAGQPATLNSLRLDTGVNLPPTASLKVSPAAVRLGQSMTFTAVGSSDPEGRPLHYFFDPDGDGADFIDNGASPVLNYAYPHAGAYSARLRVVDEQQAQAEVEFNTGVGWLRRFTPKGPNPYWVSGGGYGPQGDFFLSFSDGTDKDSFHRGGVARFDRDGELLWCRTVNTISTCQFEGMSVSSSGHLVVRLAASELSVADPPQGVSLLELDAQSGDFIRAFHLDAAGLTSAYVFYLGDMLMVAANILTPGDSPYHTEPVLMRLDEEGNILWQKRWATAPSDQRVYRGAASDAQGNIYLSGIDDLGSGSDLLTDFICSVDSSGNPRWLRFFDPHYYSADFGALQAVSGDSLVFVNETDMLRFSLSGKLLSARRYSASGGLQPNFLSATTDGAGGLLTAGGLGSYVAGDLVQDAMFVHLQQQDLVLQATRFNFPLDGPYFAGVLGSPGGSGALLCFGPATSKLPQPSSQLLSSGSLAVTMLDPPAPMELADSQLALVPLELKLKDLALEPNAADQLNLMLCFDGMQ